MADFGPPGDEMLPCPETEPKPVTPLHGDRRETLGTLAGKAADREEARGDAIVALSTMIGAMTLARVVTDRNLSSEILDRAKNHLRG